MTWSDADTKVGHLSPFETCKAFAFHVVLERGSAEDPLGIQGGSSAKTGDPGSMQCLKRGIGWGSGARTETLYNIKLAE